jgi:leucyl/phenylalanyl-tRNA--protein transferase
MRHPIPWLSPDPGAPFPDPDGPRVGADGLVAAGGDLEPERLLNAYRAGLFPWYSTGQPILWWSPDPRTLLPTAGLHLGRSLRRALRRSPWQVGADGCFEQVIAACAASPRRGQRGTWITPEMRRAYQRLHASGWAHSIEVRDDGELVGGLYGVAIGRMFYGESMFSLRPGGSRAALLALAQALAGWGWSWIDAQMPSEHLARLGAVDLPRRDFLELNRRLASEPLAPGDWSGRFPRLRVCDLAGLEHPN